MAHPGFGLRCQLVPANALRLLIRGLLLTSLCLCWIALDAELGRSQEPEFTLNVNVDLVELSVTVLDPDGRLVSGLEAPDFEVFEDQSRQEVTVFLHEDRPVSLGLVIDNSRSMEQKKERVDTAAVSFLEQSNPDDEAFLIHFDDTVRLAEGFTSDIATLDATLESITPYGQTAMFDAIMMGLDKIREGRYSGKALLLVSDGADNVSGAGYAEVLEAVRRSGVSVYPIGLLSRSSTGEQARKILQSLADVSGGRAFFPDSIDKIPAITRRIARELRELYTVGYVPTNPKRDGTWRSVRVQVQHPVGAPRMRLNYRHGYYAPATQ